MATLDDDNTNYARNSDKGDFLVAGTPLCWSPTGFVISDTTLAEQQAELQRVRREAADAKHAASILHKKLQQEQARNSTYSEVLNAFIPIAEALGFGPQLTAEVARKALSIIGEQRPAAFDFTKPFRGALPKSSPIVDAARAYKLKDGEHWLVKDDVDNPPSWGPPPNGTPWFDSPTWEYKLSVGKCGDCGRKECTPTCNAAPNAPSRALAASPDAYRAQELVPLEMADIQPGSTIEYSGPNGIVFMSILTWSHRGLRLGGRGDEVTPYGDLFLSEAYRINIGGNRDDSGQLVWKPCSKPKQN